jgi:hypothetical protein
MLILQKIISFFIPEVRPFSAEELTKHDRIYVDMMRRHLENKLDNQKIKLIFEPGTVREESIWIRRGDLSFEHGKILISKLEDQIKNGVPRK